MTESIKQFADAVLAERTISEHARELAQFMRRAEHLNVHDPVAGTDVARLLAAFVGIGILGKHGQQPSFTVDELGNRQYRVDVADVARVIER